MEISRRDVVVGLLTMPGALNAVAIGSDGQHVMGPTVFNWNDMKPEKTATGEVRHLCKGPTATLDQLEMHVTTLNPGMAISSAASSRERRTHRHSRG